jgi:hypothetical protein
MSRHWATFLWLSICAALIVLAVRGAWDLFNPPKCELGIGALL